MGGQAIGARALGNNIAVNNTAIGYRALENNTTGASNIAIGYSAGMSLTIGHSNIDIGNPGVAGEFNTMRIGGGQARTFIAGIHGVGVPGGAPVCVLAGGQLGAVASTQRLKEAIKPMDKASEAILALKPVTFRYKKEIDPGHSPQFGLVAEEVEKVNPDLVARDEEGKPYTVRYDQINAMLLNEFLKEHKKVEEQQASIAELKSMVAQQKKDFQATASHQQEQIEALSAGLQKVSAQLEASKPAPRVVNNP